MQVFVWRQRGYAFLCANLRWRIFIFIAFAEGNILILTLVDSPLLYTGLRGGVILSKKEKDISFKNVIGNKLNILKDLLPYGFGPANLEK